MDVIVQHIPTASGYPVGRMAFNVIFLLSLGSVYTFSSWANMFIGTRSNPGLGVSGSPGAFPNWRLSDLNFVYSLGILGAFSMPLGGYLHDKIGSSATFILGLVLMLSGFAAIYATATTTIIPEHWQVWVVGLGYFVEEQGSCTIYMAIALDTLTSFPEDTMATSMAIVNVGYTISSILVSLVFLSVQPTLWQLFGFIALSTSVCTCIRLVLGGLPRRGTLKLEAKLTTGAQQESYHAALSTSQFFHLGLLHVLVLPSCTVLLGLVKVVGNVGGINGSMLATLATVCNVAGGMLSGAIYDKYKASITSGNAILLIETGFVIVFGMMAVGCGCYLPMTVASGALLAVFLFGAVCPLCSVYVKDNFTDGAQGLVWGLAGFLVPLANFPIMMGVIPANVVSLSDLSDAMKTFTLLAATCAVALAMHQWRLGGIDKKMNLCDFRIV